MYQARNLLSAEASELNEPPIFPEFPQSRYIYCNYSEIPI
jgi:hypothetical protein